MIRVFLARLRELAVTVGLFVVLAGLVLGDFYLWRTAR